ncbi:tryptophan synthase subunit alpha [Paenibacillus sp. ACRRX]|uniref:tryptophan synthase subunit alpha n=1 Tax=Paenibacillus sp. ACRRX TaxID=2918206 RepID=UPI001EF3EBCB|nr:tryptophan synthase subunit alpha [Paenibacillus sp. ACRRX]MCG7406463.1 tryptophan synthase subunit alpha [Paenibacillus sp. ACRRX]
MTNVGNATAQIENRIDTAFAQLKARGETALIPFITVGDPNRHITLQLLLGMEEAGADAIELGIPYSDPLADGPVIEKASARALLHNITISDGIELAKQARLQGAKIPYILFTYYNPVLQYGLESLFQALSEADISGIIIPDLPVEESGPVLEIADHYQVHLVPLVAPTSKERIQRIVNSARGFVYCVSSLGVTGTRDTFEANVEAFLDEVRASTALPIGVGFGISTAEHVRRFSPHCDGVIVGSAIVRQIENAIPLLLNPDTSHAGVLQICEFVRQLKS